VDQRRVKELKINDFTLHATTWKQAEDSDAHRIAGSRQTYRSTDSGVFFHLPGTSQVSAQNDALGVKGDF
jgi:hypothetical protein